MTQRKSESLRVRLTEDEHRELAYTAEKNSVTKSRFLRRLIRESCGCGPDFFSAELHSVDAAAHQLLAVGRNLNQIARKINMGEYDGNIDPALLGELAEYSENVARSVGQLARRSRTRWTPKRRSSGHQ